MPRPKKPITKLNKQMKDEFEAALEPPAKSQTVEIEEPKRLPRIDPELPPPTNIIEDGEPADDWQPYAPKVGEAPLAAGETQETTIQPGDWSTPKAPAKKKDAEVQAEVSSDMALESTVEPPESLDTPIWGGLPMDTRERLEQAIDAIEWLAGKTKGITPRSKEILRLRRDNLKDLLNCLQ